MSLRKPLILVAGQEQEHDQTTDELDAGVVNVRAVASISTTPPANSVSIYATTSNTIAYKDNGGTVRELIDKTQITETKAITVESPTASEDIAMFYTNIAITVAEVRSVVRGTTPSVSFTIRHGTDRSGTGNTVTSTPMTCTNTTSGLSTTVFTGGDPTIPAGSWVWLETTATSGTVEEFSVTIRATKD